MATYATYRHVELDRIGLGKKRILKPPGGGSSISFTDSDASKPPVQCVTQEIAKVKDVVKETAAPTMKEEKDDSTVGSIPTNQEASSAPQSQETNGTVKTDDLSDPIPSPTPSPSEVVDCSPDVPSPENPITNGTSNGGLLDTVENSADHVSTNIDTDTKETASTVSDTVIIDSLTTNGTSEHKTKADLPPLNIKTSSTHSSTQNSPTSVSPSASSPNVSSPSAKGQEDTKDRLFGQPATFSPTIEQPQQRKIKDHMRSSIFGPDDSYTPARSSRGNAPATTASPQEPIDRPTAGQRGRVPPGGFSTKLW